MNRKDLNIDDIRRAYDSGDSVLKMSKDFSVSRPVILRRLAEMGVAVRSRSEANRIRMSRLSPADRSDLARAAHDAVRGVKRSDEEILKRSAAREAVVAGSSQLEDAFAGFLADRGIEFVRQKAIGKYNVDFALTSCPVAVEIFGGGWHNSGRHASRHPERIEYLLSQSWSIVIIWATTRWGGGSYFDQRCADYVVSLAKILSTRPSGRGQYHVIRGDGKYASVSSLESNKPSLVLGRNG